MILEKNYYLQKQGFDEKSVFKKHDCEKELFSKKLEFEYFYRKFFVLSYFELKFFVLSAFELKFFLSCQLLNWNFYNVSDFKSTFLQRVSFGIKKLTTRQI